MKFLGNQKTSKIVPFDEKADMRKTIGVIVELQSIFETEKVITADTIFKVCEDMGISTQNAVKNILLRETAKMYGVDLDVEQNQYITKKLIIDSLQKSQKQQKNSSIHLHFLCVIFTYFYLLILGLMGLSSEVMDILKKVNFDMVDDIPSISSIQHPGEFERQKPYEPEFYEDISYVYPLYEEESNLNCQQDPKDIESTINKLTYAFASNKDSSFERNRIDLQKKQELSKPNSIFFKQQPLKNKFADFNEVFIKYF